MTRRILHVVTNVSHYADPGEPTGLWLSELDDLSGGPGRCPKFKCFQFDAAPNPSNRPH